MGATSNYGWEIPDVGADADTWGTIQNALYDDIDAQVKANETAAGVAAPTGAIMDFLRTTAPTGWVVLDGSIGDASSAATTRRNADTEALFTILWGFTFLGIFNDSGIGTTRGANAAADFAAHKCIVFPDQPDKFRRSYKSGGSSAGIGVVQVEQIGPHSHPVPQFLSSSLRGDSGSLNSFSGSSNGSVSTSNNTGTENRPTNIAYLTCIKL